MQPFCCPKKKTDSKILKPWLARALSFLSIYPEGIQVIVSWLHWLSAFWLCSSIQVELFRSILSQCCSAAGSQVPADPPQNSGWLWEEADH